MRNLSCHVPLSILLIKKSTRKVIVNGNFFINKMNKTFLKTIDNYVNEKKKNFQTHNGLNILLYLRPESSYFRSTSYFVATEVWNIVYNQRLQIRNLKLSLLLRPRVYWVSLRTCCLRAGNAIFLTKGAVNVYIAQNMKTNVT